MYQFRVTFGVGAFLILCLWSCSGSSSGSGPKWRDGVDGVDGADGRNGEAGPVGPAGPQGVPGEKGDQGFRWRGEWTADTTYVEGDAVRDSAATGVFIAVAESAGEPPVVGSAAWDLMLSSDSLVKPECPTGMSRLPNQVCADREHRQFAAADGFENFAPSKAMLLCFQAGARLCTLDEHIQRAACGGDPRSCPPGSDWRGEGVSVPSACLPAMVPPGGEALVLEGPANLTGTEVDGAYVGVVSIGRPDVPTISLAWASRTYCEDEWEEKGYAGYICCTDM